jgi:hypothetical protein
MRVGAGIVLLAITIPVLAEDKRPMNINVFMMEATCKIVGDGSTGSGFILGTPDPNDTNVLFFTLVTAHHVLNGVKGSQVTLVTRKLIDRDKQDYQRIEVPIVIRKDGKQLWTKHRDVDLAAMFIRLPQGCPATVIPATLLLTDERIKEFEITPGTELLCLRYPLGAEANPTGFPILRSGKIASFPILPTAVTKSFLFDFRVFPGNSGGPVYLYETNPFYGGGTHIGTIQGVMGIVTSERNITQRIEQLYERRETVTPLALGEVIHASFIKELVGTMTLPARQ